MDSDHLGLFSLFVDNLLEDVGLFWFRNFFNQYGVVKDAYIRRKPSKVTNRRFGLCGMIVLSRLRWLYPKPMSFGLKIECFM